MKGWVSLVGWPAADDLHSEFVWQRSQCYDDDDDDDSTGQQYRRICLNQKKLQSDVVYRSDAGERSSSWSQAGDGRSMETTVGWSSETSGVKRTNGQSSATAQRRSSACYWHGNVHYHLHWQMMMMMTITMSSYINFRCSRLRSVSLATLFLLLSY